MIGKGKIGGKEEEGGKGIGRGNGMRGDGKSKEWYGRGEGSGKE